MGTRSNCNAQNRRHSARRCYGLQEVCRPAPIFTLIFCVLLLLTPAFGQRKMPRASSCPPVGCPPPPAASAPSLTSVAPASIAQGGQQVRVVITGANFRPGAQLLIGGVAGNANISIGSSTVLSSSVIVATVSVAPQAGAGPLTVDVMNADGTSTLRAGSGRSIFITASSSLAAPLQVQTIVLTNPRDGVLLQQGDEVYGTALLAGTGTGVVTGEWLWDGMASEQFTARLVGGESASLRTMHTLPTLQVGEHALAIRVTGPTLLQTKTISVVVNPSTWQEMQLLEPQPGELFLADAAPKLRWTIVPGADKYQVGFSSNPYFSSVSRWYDVRDTSWQVPDDVWSKLPPGTLYWTVRAVELSGEARRPALLRSIVRTRKDALTATTAQPKAARSRAPCWNGDRWTNPPTTASPSVPTPSSQTSFAVI